MNGRSDRGPRMARRIATATVVLFVVLWIVRVSLAVSTGSLTDNGGGAADIALDLLAVAGSGLSVWVGWAIVTRQPRNAIGWLLLAIPLIGALAFIVGDYTTEALARRPGSLPYLEAST